MDIMVVRGTRIAATLLGLAGLLCTAEAGDVANPPITRSTGAVDGAWDVTVGAGILIKPEFAGADEAEALVLPYVNLTWSDRILFNVIDGLGVHLYTRGGLSLDGGIGFDFGRDDDDDPILRGLGDVEFAPTLRLRADYRVGPISTFADVDKHVGGTDGLQAEIGIRAAIPLAVLSGSNETVLQGRTNPFTQGPVLAVSLSAEYADDKYLAGYYGVDAAQSARSGLAPFSPSAGFASAGVDVLFVYPLAGQWALNALGSYARITGDAADSPTVLSRDQSAFGLFATHRF